MMTKGQLLPLHTVTLLANLNYHSNILKGEEYFARKGELLLQPLGHSTDFFLMNTLYHMVPFTQKKKTKKKPQDSIIPPHPKKTHQNNMPVDQKSVIKATVWKNKQQI